MRCNIPARDLAQKLDGTICRYKGDPVLVRVDDAVLNLYPVTDTRGKRIARINPSDPDFDIAGVPLGYIQSADNINVWYLSRIPVRRTKQGLEPRSVRVRNISGTNVDHKTPAQIVIYTEGFKQMVLNQYIPLGDAMKLLRDRWASDSTPAWQVAISRNIALGIDKQGIIKVFYKTEYVGWIAPDQFTVNVKADAFSWVVSKYLSHELDWKVA